MTQQNINFGTTAANDGEDLFSAFTKIQANFVEVYGSSGVISHAITDVVSAATCDIGAAATDRIRITGSVTITSFGTSANKLRFVHFDAALTLTYNATTLILPDAANKSVEAGDAAIFSSDASGNWRCLNYYSADDDVDSSDVTFTQSGTGAVERTALAKMRETVTLLDFIPVAEHAAILAYTSTTDVSSYVQAAFNAGYRVRGSAGKFYCGNTNITVTNKKFFLEGDGMGVTILQWNGSSGGISFTQDSDTYMVGISRLSLLQEGAAVGTAISYNGTGQKVTGVIQNRTSHRLTLSDVEMRGAVGTTTDGWNKHVVGVNAHRVALSRLHVTGKRTAPITSNSASAYEFSGDGSPTEVVVSTCWAYWVQEALSVDDYEGVFVDKCNFVAVDYGVRCLNAGAEPQLQFTNGHISAYVRCIDAVSCWQPLILGNYLIDRSDATGTVELVRLSQNCSFGRIAYNNFNKFSSATVNAIVIGDDATPPLCVRNQINANIFENVDAAVTVGGGGSGTRLNDNEYFGVSSELVDSGAATVRRDGQDGTAALPSLTWIGDSNTGFYIIANNRAGFAAGGSNVFEMSSQGFVMANGLGFGTGTSSGNTALLKAYDVDDATYRTFGTLTAGNTPSFTLGSTTFGITATFLNTGLKLIDTNGTHVLTVAPGTNLTADRTWTVTTGDADRTTTIPSSGTLAMVDVEDQTITGGARVTSKDLGTVTTGTTTPDPGDRSLQHYINGGAHTLAPGSNAGSYVLDIENNGSAGAITTSGWTKVIGDPFTTTNGHKFRCVCSVAQGGSLLSVQAMQ